MERQHIHAPLDREAVYHAIWPELADDIHLFGVTDFMVDRMSDAEGDALEYLLDQITGNALLNTADPLLVVSDLYDHVQQTLDTSPSAAVQSEWQAKRDAILQAFTRMLPNRPLDAEDHHGEDADDRG